MKKNFIYMLAVALISMCMVACSSGDDSASNENTTPQKGDTKVILTGRIEKPMTRSTVDDQGNSEWQENDQIAVRYQKADDSYGVATATITQTGVTWANFTATLDNPKTGDSNVTLVYPASAYKESDPFYDLDVLNSQAGTLTDIGTYRNIQSNTATVNVLGTTATLTSSVLLDPKVCISKFSITEGDGTTPVIAKGLSITDGSRTYTVSGNASTYYVAMEPVSGANVQITLVGVKKRTYTKLTDPSEVSYGQFIGIKNGDSDHEAYLESTSSTDMTLTATDVTLKKGDFYNQPISFSDYTRIAVIAHVGAVSNYCNNFIALALEDVYSGTKTLAAAATELQKTNNWAVQHKLKIGSTTYSNADATAYDQVQDNSIDDNANMTTTHASNTRPAGTGEGQGVGLGWRVPSVTDFRYIFQDLKIGRTTGDYVIEQSKITAISPVGISDQDAHYYSGQTTFKYGTRSDMLYTYINNLCENTNLKGQYYWISSQVISRSGVLQDKKAWRFSFSADQFEWNENVDQSLARLVFVY